MPGRKRDATSNPAGRPTTDGELRMSSSATQSTSTTLDGETFTAVRRLLLWDHPRWPVGGYVCLLLSVAGMSWAAPLVLHLHEVTAPGDADAVSVLAAWRSVFALLAVAGLVLARMPSSGVNVLRATPRDVLRAAMVGAVFACYLGLWTPTAGGGTSTAAATGLSFTAAPLWVLLGARLTGHRLRPATALGCLLGLAGVMALPFAGRPAGNAGGPGVQVYAWTAMDLQALLSGLVIAVYFVLTARVRTSLDVLSFMLISHTSTAVLLLAWSAVQGQQLWGHGNWLLITACLLAVGVQLFGYGLNSGVVNRLGPTLATCSIILEAPGATVLSWLWLGEGLTPLGWTLLLMSTAGALVAIAATAPQMPRVVATTTPGRRRYVPPIRRRAARAENPRGPVQDSVSALSPARPGERRIQYALTQKTTVRATLAGSAVAAVVFLAATRGKHNRLPRQDPARKRNAPARDTPGTDT
jgi:drug/metabolite transporter (DMT)-like permease